jgi:hypothetical protein
MFNRRWIDWVRAVYVLRSTRPRYLPPIYDRQGYKPSPTAVVVKESAPPTGLATRDVTIEDGLESSQGGENFVTAEVTIPLRVAPVPASVFACVHYPGVLS